MASSLIAVSRLARRFGRRWALGGVSFDIQPATVTLITGPKGSGKTTLLRCLATGLRPDQGEIRFKGENLWRNRIALREKIGFLSHDTLLYDELSSLDNLRVWGRLLRKKPDLNALLERVGLESRPEPCRTYSAGMLRRLAIAILLLKDPEVILLDEPFGALDPTGRAFVADLIKDSKDQGKTVLLSSHLTEIATPLADHALQLDGGLMVETS